VSYLRTTNVQMGTTRLAGSVKVGNHLAVEWSILRQNNVTSPKGRSAKGRCGVPGWAATFVLRFLSDYSVVFCKCAAPLWSW